MCFIFNKKNLYIETNFRDKKYLVVILTKLKIILDTKKIITFYY